MSDGVFDPSRKIATGVPSKIQDSVLLAARLGRCHGFMVNTTHMQVKTGVYGRQFRDERWPQMK